MKIKNLLILTAAVLGTSALAQEDSKLKLTYGNETGAKLKPLETVGHTENPLKGTMAQRSQLPALINTPTPQDTGYRSGDENSLQLDSIVNKNPDGSNNMIWRFTYNDLGKETKRQICYWNTQTAAWDQPSEEYLYKWNDEGLILSEQVVGYGAGKRIEYTYDDQGRGIEQIQYELDANGNWAETSKGEYTYDSEDNIIEEYIYVWNGDKWENNTHNTATWDSKKRQTGFTGYSWNGTEWVGSEKNEYIWFDGPQDPDYVEGTSPERMTYKTNYFWINGQWAQYYIFTNSINDEGRLIGQTEKFYNRTYKKWSGGDDWDGRLGFYTSWEGIHTLDKHGNQTLGQTYTCLPDSSRWIEPGVGTYDWTYNEDGSRTGLYKSIIYDYDEAYNKIGETVNQQVYYGYNADNKKTWLLQQILSEDGTMEDLFEEKYGYNERNQLTYTAIWDWIDGVRTPTSYTKYIYNENGELEETIVMGNGNLAPIGLPAQYGPELDPEDETGWVNSSRWIYEHKNGYQISKLGYLWRDESWTPNSGESVEYDWNYPASEIIVPNGWYDPFKIDIIRTHMADGNGGWTESTRHYHYSMHGASNINHTEHDADVRVFPTIITDYFQVIAPENCTVRVYSLDGRNLICTPEKKVSMSNMSSGVYIVDVDGHKTKIVKK